MHARAESRLTDIPWRPLGRLLVERGLLDERQLAEALREQERTARPLGEIVRTRYLVSPADLGDVLAEQRRLELELDHHLGHWSRPERPRPRAVAPDERLAALQAALEDKEETIAVLGLANRRRRDELTALRAQLAEQETLIGELRERLNEHRPDDDATNVG